MTPTTKQLIIAAIVVLILAVLWYLYATKRLEMFAAAPQVTVTYYFMKGCPWCQKFMPEWKEFKDLVTAQKLAVTTVEVDAEQKADLVSKKNITGFPTVRITGTNGKETDYEGDRTAKALLAEVKKHL
jgi:glutaredoxin